MPRNFPKESVADAELSNLGPKLDHDESGDGTSSVGVTNETAGKGSQMDASSRTPSIACTQDNERDLDFTRDSSGARRSNPTQDASRLQVPDGGKDGNDRRPVETSIWDWDTPLPSNSHSDPDSYLFEPQGELLRENVTRRFPTEANIPTAVADSSSDWNITKLDGGADSEGFAVPRRPTGNVSSTAGAKRKSASDQSSLTSKRASRTMSESGDDAGSPTDNLPPLQGSHAQAGPTTRARTGTDRPHVGTRHQSIDSIRPSLSITGGGPQRGFSDPGVPMVLPARKVFPIQIGDRLFRLSGASISSDAPSYFSQFFEEQLRNGDGADSVRTLYIDRDPATFEDISLHLQGYHIEPKDGPHFVKLFADAQFFSLPRLTAQLFSSTIYIRIGDSEFQIPRDLFSNPGDSPNYFSLGFSIFFTSPTEVFPGLSQRTLIRPPSILPRSVPNRSAKTFADLLHILKGYPVEVRSEQHRQELLRDARYYHLKGLEQRIIPHNITFNLGRQKSEILIRLEDIRTSGVSFVADRDSESASAAASPTSSTASSILNGPGWIHYQRPYVDSEAFSLIVEIGGDENTILTVEPRSPSSLARMARATFHRQTLSRITRLFSVIADKMNLPITQPLGLMMLERGAGVASLPVSPRNTGMSEEKVKVRIGRDADVVVDGNIWTVGGDAEEVEDSPMEVDTGQGAAATRKSKRRRQADEESQEVEEWILSKAQWRLRVQPLTGGAQSGKSGMEVILAAVKIEAYSTERSRNAERAFLT
ncbi:hypothetical protein HII31_04602 [Pseudocercospora fuligena]|uniref:Potassium channel tetramerisation-type BTB domain-containing protein n=1 Tax=Pseudocercospora fuligena TaxID=685502 RepID=A0A8H6RN59_9PEZI|nr:hypothetical protein HII31_04602 [Pseudocercospora fuligena]